MKKNVLILLNSLSGGGAQSLVLAQMRYYDKEKFNIYVISFRSGRLYEKFKELGKNNYIYLDKKERFSIKAIFKLFKFIYIKNIDIIHTHLIEADTYGFILKLLFPRIHLYSTRHGENKFRQLIHWGSLNFLISILNKRVICVSQSLEKYIRKNEFIPKRKLEMIYNGIDVNYFIKENHSKLRKQFEDINVDNELIIGIVGRLKRLKGHDYLFRAVQKLKEQEVNNIKVLVIGEGKHMRRLIDLRNQLNLKNEIKFLGFCQNIKDFYNIFDVLCLPSNYEGLPLVLIEAMSCERLVLCSDIPNNLEVVDNEIDGITFKKGDVDDLAFKINNIINNKYDVDLIRKNARKKVLERFNFQKTIKNWENLYLKK